MILRRQRFHETGKSNLDYKQIDITRSDLLPRLTFLSTAKSKTFADTVVSKMKRQPPPISQSQINFYEKNHLKMKQKVPIPKERFAQLEEKELRKRVFTGESYTLYQDQYSKNPFKQKKLTNLFQYQLNKEKLVDEKHEVNATAIAETQFVGFDQYNKQTLEGRVDLEKVREIRRAIRRRYANRTNFQKIFNQWDYNSTGVINPKNAFDMIKKMGIKINFDECRVLIASSDYDSSGDLNLNEFMDLIFNSNDTLNVNLKSLPVISEEEYMISTADNVMEKLNQDVQKNRQEKHLNQLSVILKNKLPTIKTLVVSADSLNQGFVSHEKYEEIMKKLAIPETILGKNDVQFIFNRHKIDEHKFNYKNFIDYLRKYEFIPEDIYIDPALTEKKKDEKQKLLTQFNYEEDKKIYVFDPNNVNSCHLQQIRNDSIKVFRIIERYFDTKDSFDKYLMSQMKINSQQEFENKQISKKDLIKAMQNLFLNVGEKDVKKEELQSFLSSFTYNLHDHIPANQISKTIYEENDYEWFYKIQWKMRRAPPPVQFQYDEELQKQKQIEEIENDKENIDKQQITYDQLRKSSAPFYPKQINQVLEKFENRVFCGTQKAYEIFKQFDVDNDGYVSHKDLVQKIKELNVLQNEEIITLLNYMDPEKKGYANFQEFSNKLKNGMLNNDSLGRQLVIPYVYPSKEQITDIKNMLPDVKNKINDAKKTFYPSEQINFYSRFSSTPAFKDTFSSFQPQQNSAMFLNQTDRFNVGDNHRIQYQMEERNKKNQYEEGRIQKKKENLINIQNKVEQQIQIDDQKSEQRMKAKGLRQWTYEHRAHLQNNWK